MFHSTWFAISVALKRLQLAFSVASMMTYYRW